MVFYTVCNICGIYKCKFSYQVFVLGIYMLAFMIILPVIVGMWWNRSIKYSKEKVLLSTTQLYYYFFNKTPNMNLKRKLYPHNLYWLIGIIFFMPGSAELLPMSRVLSNKYYLHIFIIQKSGGIFWQPRSYINMFTRWCHWAKSYIWEYRLWNFVSWLWNGVIFLKREWGWNKANYIIKKYRFINQLKID